VPARPNPTLLLALLATYLIWGSTYLAIRIGVAEMPPLLMAGIRFLLAGCGMYLVLRLRGAPAPTPIQWRNAGLIGSLMLTVGNGAVTWAEQSVSSGMAAMVVGVVPLLTVLFSRLWGYRPGRAEWLGIGIGLIGMLALVPVVTFYLLLDGTLLLLIAACSWAFAAVWGTRLQLPPGLMSAATQMLLAGLLLALLSLAGGERMHGLPGWQALAALFYLTLFGSVIAYSAFSYLLRHARPALASSYAYVNPPVAVLLGWALGGEQIGASQWLAMPLICLAVVFVASARQK